MPWWPPQKSGLKKKIRCFDYLGSSIGQKCLNVRRKKILMGRTEEKRRMCAWHRTGTLSKCQLRRRREKCPFSNLAIRRRLGFLPHLTRVVSVSRVGTQAQKVLVWNPTEFDNTYLIKPTCSTRECILNVCLLIHQGQGRSLLCITPSI